MFTIISGGQTGVDRAALDVALMLGFPIEGFCPLSRKAEDGRIPDHYPLEESSSSSYSERTKKNVELSDGVLLLSSETLSGGTLLTKKTAINLSYPYLVLLPKYSKKREKDFNNWIQTNKILRIDIAGPRESKFPGIYKDSLFFLTRLLNTFRTNA